LWLAGFALENASGGPPYCSYYPTADAGGRRLPSFSNEHLKGNGRSVSLATPAAWIENSSEFRDALKVARCTDVD
jgi:hypothetical protein